MSGGSYEETEQEKQSGSKHAELVSKFKASDDCVFVPERLKRTRVNGPGIENVSWDQRSHYTFTPPVKRKDKVLESYTNSLPYDLRNEFLKEFEKDDGKKCAKKKKLILAKYVVACQHSLGFDLKQEERKLGGKVKISAEDLP